ncbi:MAG: toprim domain-containing protein, partial [Anaerolineaceae bacterium]|nr:toprim domain-containing protein [Anaerolineaceae bacterium]
SERQEGGGIFDRFRNRIMFPIRDSQGRMAGFGARILDPDDSPKFLNSPQTALFDKGSLLYGLDRGRKAIRARNQAVIVEGYLDVIACHQAGFENTVSPMGTALTEEQLRLLKRFTQRMVLALDADSAGEKATLRGLDLARQALDRTAEISAGEDGIFNAHGLVRQEGRLQADLRVATLPPGKDPDEVLQEDPASWERLLQAAQPIVAHVMDMLTAQRDLEDPKSKAEIAALVLPLIEDVPNPVERDAYRQQLARRLKVDESSLTGARSAPARSSHRMPARRQRLEPPPAAIHAPIGTLTGDNLEKHAIQLLLRKPDAVYLLDRALQRAGLARFQPEDLENSGYQLLARLVIQSLEQDQLDALEYILQNTSESLRSQLDELRVPFERGEPRPDLLLEDLVRTVLLHRKTRLDRELTQLRYLQEEIQHQDQPGLETYHEMALKYTQTRARLDRALSQPMQFE